MTTCGMSISCDGIAILPKWRNNAIIVAPAAAISAPIQMNGNATDAHLCIANYAGRFIMGVGIILDGVRDIDEVAQFIILFFWE
jgi:hypothetical protein